MTEQLQTWLEKPSPAAKKIDQLRGQLDELKVELGANILGDTLKNLEKAEVEAKRLRQREAAEAIAELCRPLGVVLTPGEPQKRKPRTKKQRPGTTPPTSSPPSPKQPDTAG
ncbi:MAG: hypothetical protein AAF656_02410 [Planctomycetota bacterium]